MAFNAVAGLNPFTIIAVAIAAVAAHRYFTGSISLDRHGTLSRQYGAQQLAAPAECSSYWSGCYGFVSGVVGFFSSIWIGITAVFNNVVAFFAAMGAYNFGGDICASGADHRSVLTFKGQIFAAVFRRLGFHVATFTPVVQFFGGIFNGAWNLIVGVWGAAVGGSVVIVGRYSHAVSVVAGWFGGVFRGA